MIRTLPAADRIAVPWKNGGGVTREVAVWPPGAGLEDFDWRISIAEVREPGPFSTFANIDRTLTILQGAMTLEFPGRSIALSRSSAPLPFAGDEACFGRPTGGVVTDLNVMVRRGAWRAEVTRPSASFITPGVHTAIVLAADRGAWRSGDTGGTLEVQDAILSDGSDEIFFDGAALGIALFRTVR